MQPSLLTKLILLTSSVLFCTGFKDSIGDITEHIGDASIQRETDSLSVSSGLNIFLNDIAETVNGRMSIEFLDKSNLRLTEHSQVVIDTVIYDPDPNKSKMVLNFAQGTARFASGKLALMNKANVEINTPVATIGIRGTDFTTTIDEIGRSLIILLPDENGNSSGEITVSNEAGTVVLDEPYEATTVSTISSLPVEPVKIRNITVNQINNMFIVSPPKEIKEISQENSSSNSTSIIDIDYLQFDELDQDELSEDELQEFTELDIDLLDVDFLQDVLVEIEEEDPLRDKNGQRFITVSGTKVGFDPVTQYNTIFDRGAGTVLFYREVTGTISLEVPSDSDLNIYTYTNEAPSIIRLGDGGDSIIIIRQEGG